MFVEKLSIGGFGSEVHTLHDILRKYGFEIPFDEIDRNFFGPKTRDAICEFQRKLDLEVNGCLDSATSSLLMKALPVIQTVQAKPISSIKKESIKLEDWSGYIKFGGIGHAYAPQNESEVISLVRYCHQNRLKLRVVGCQTSWSAFWFCRDAIMTTKYLNSITEINIEKKTITCGPGTRLDEIHKKLWEKGLVLDTSPAIGWITIAGAISTGSHGSGRASISSSLIGCRLVIANGDVFDIQEGDEALDAVRISMGMLGILVSVTLRVVDAFYIYLRQTRILTKDWKLFLTTGQMSYALWFPHTEWTVLANAEVITDPAIAAKITSEISLKKMSSNNVENAEYLDIDTSQSREVMKRLAISMPSILPAYNRYLLDVSFRDLQQVGPAYEILMSYQSEPIAGGEWAVPVSQFEAALTEIQSLIAKGDLYLPLTWFKKVLPETAWLSAATEECVQCGVYYSLPQRDTSLVKEMIMKVERIMFKYSGRSHLGKLIYLKPQELKLLYPNWKKFNALRKKLDPYGMFWTEQLSEKFGDSSF